MHTLRPVYLACTTLIVTLPAHAADLLGTDAWPMDQAQQALADEIGTAQIHDITIYDDRVAVTADHPTDPQQTADYVWDQQTVRGAGSFANFAAMGMGDIKPFPLAELAFERLPEVKAAALDAFAADGARIVEIEASQPTTRTSKKLLPLWEVTLAEPGGDIGTVWLTARAQVVDVVLPQSRQAAAGPWLAPATVEQTLARLGEEFGPDAKFLEIFIDDTKALVTMEDPQQPGGIAEFLMDAQSISRWGISGMPDPFAPSLDRGFTIADIAALDADRLAELEQRTLERMGMPDMTVFRYTVSRNLLILSPEDDRLLVEVRAQAPDQWTSGRVAYDMAGEEVDAVLP